MHNSADKSVRFSALAAFSKEIGSEIKNQLNTGVQPQAQFSSIGGTFLIEFLDTPTETILKTIYINIGPKLDISGVGDNVTCHKIEGVSIDFYPGARETTAYLPDADHVIKLIKLLEDETKSPFNIMESYGG